MYLHKIFFKILFEFCTNLRLSVTHYHAVHNVKAGILVKYQVEK